MNVLVRTRRLDGSGVRIPVRKATVHPKYNRRLFDYDIAIIEVATPDLWYPVDLAITEPLENEKLLVTGWGLNEKGQTPIDLQALEVPVVSSATCNRPSSYDGQITSRMFCAGPMTGGSGSCKGDSGGPITGGVGNSLLTGVVSWGYVPCALPKFPGVFTKISDPEIRSFITPFAAAPVYRSYRNEYVINVEGYGSLTNVYLRYHGTLTTEIWGTRKYADLQGTADAYCRGLGYSSAISWTSESCGEDESSFARYNSTRGVWESRSSGSANNRDDYCRYPLMTSVKCNNDVKVTLKMGGVANSAGVGSLSCSGRSCSVKGNIPSGKSCSVSCPLGSTVALGCVSNNSGTRVQSGRFTKNGSSSRTSVSNVRPIEGICQFSAVITRPKPIGIINCRHPLSNCGGTGIHAP